jgi:hypothetical protein
MRLAEDRKQLFALGANFLLVSLMLTCLSVTFVQLGEAIFTGWQGEYLIVLSFFVALEAMYSARRVSEWNFPDTGLLVYRATEWVLILAFLKISSYFSTGLWQLTRDLPLWQENFGRNFLSGEFIFGAIVLLAVWMFAGRYSLDLLPLEVNERVLRIEWESGVFENRPAARQRLANQTLWVGILMIFLAAALRYERAPLWFELPTLRFGVYNLMVYFFLGLVFLSLTQYSLMRALWLMDKMPVNTQVANRWLVYSAVLIGVLALVSSVLPTSYSLGFLAMLNYLLYIITAVTGFLASALMFPIFLLINLIMSLFPVQDAERLPVEPPQPPPLPPPAAEEAITVPWVELLQSIAFWVVFLAVIGFALYFYLHDNEWALRAVRRVRLFAILANFWNSLRQRAAQANRELAAAVEDSWRRLRARIARSRDRQNWQWVSLRKLSPRQQVIFYYLALLRRGGEHGVARQPSQTPYEYARTLAQALQNASDGAAAAKAPEFEQDISTLTDEFLEARYSQHEIQQQDAVMARNLWQRIGKFLRRVWRRSESR